MRHPPYPEWHRPLLDFSDMDSGQIDFRKGRLAKYRDDPEKMRAIVNANMREERKWAGRTDTEWCRYFHNARVNKQLVAVVMCRAGCGPSSSYIGRVIRNDYTDRVVMEMVEGRKTPFVTEVRFFYLKAALTVGKHNEPDEGWYFE